MHLSVSTNGVFMRLSLRRASCAAAIVLAVSSLSAGVGAHASLTDDFVVSDNPVNNTPNVNQGAVT